VLKKAGGSVVITFSDDGKAAPARTPCRKWHALLSGSRAPAAVEESVLADYSAREMTRRQCAVFDAVLARAGTRAA